MQVGDIVVRKSYGKDITFKIVDIEEKDNRIIYVIKGINIRVIADAQEEDLEVVDVDYRGEKDKILNSKVSNAISTAVNTRNKSSEKNIDFMRGNKNKKKENASKNKKEEVDELVFGRPGRILHIDADKDYLEVCLKVYKELSLDAIGFAVSEKDQVSRVVELAKQVKPDIIVLTGHDSILKNTKDYLNLNNYRNSKYYIDAVAALRDYNSSYDELVIFAGACQSCYEGLLDAGANFASSPNRVLIHCLDPVFICEKIAYAKINDIVSVKDVIEGTITGNRGIGGIQTRGKYREGYPKSAYI